MSTVTTRDYDVVLYGAGGFTGRQTVEYFATHAPSGIRWAIAGRNREKLEAIRSAIGAPARSEDVLVADSRDQAAVDAVVSRARIVVSTAGPFALYGTPVVDACVRYGVHYVDITGEIPWVRELVARYHERAEADATRIIPCCGFDSVPSDLGALLIARQMQSAHGVPCTEVRAYYQMAGGLNGGTIASIMNMIRTGRVERSHDLAPVRYDSAIGTWTGPFVMAPINAWIVRRSAALHAEWREAYGRDFSYREVLKFDPPLGRVKAIAVTTGFALFFGALRSPVTRAIIEPVLPKPGTGPSVRTMDGGWFRCELLGSSEHGRTVHGLIRGQGDPGNRATVRFLCEAALCLALDAAALPGGPQRGGVLTPATGLGVALVDRLRRAGVTIEVPAVTTSRDSRVRTP
jgi:short subunit dehydrogenase-like uncharacterized protein